MQLFTDNIQDQYGNAVDGASVLISVSAGGSPGAAATIYADNGVTPKANPLTTNTKGEFSFYAAGGTYIPTVTISGGSPVVSPAITLFDPDDLAAATGPGLIGFDASETYAAGTVGARLTDIAASGGSSLVGFIQAGTGAVAITMQDKAREIVSVKDFGAVGDGVIDDTAAIQAAIDYVIALGGGAVYAPRGTYRITDVLIMDTGVYATGVSLYGDGRNTIIAQEGVGLDAIHFSTTQFLQNSFLRDLQITCAATSGHVINIVYGCTTCFFENVDLVQNNPAKSLIYGDYTSFGGGVYDHKFRGGSWYCDPASTVPGFKIIANGTIFNENNFENLRCYNSNALQFFHITTAVTGTIWLVNNTWENINFENCKGGGWLFDSAKNWKLGNASFWDAGGAYVNHLIDMVAGAGYENSACTFINVGRHGDSLAAGVRDIRIVSGQDSVVINCFTQSGDIPSYDFNSKRVTVIGRLYNVLNGSNAATILPDGSVLPTSYADDAYADKLHLGGRNYAEAAQIYYSGGYVQVVPILAGGGLALWAKTGGGTDSKILWDTAEFYPLTDNSASCGVGSGRWSVVYSATGAINTSDEREKTLTENIPDAWLDAWGDVNYRRFKWKDAVEKKGDGARWHAGVIAQEVDRAFAARGLDARTIGLLCYDEWPDKFEDVLNANGQPTGERRLVTAAGNRWGLRYQEAAALEAAWVRRELGRLGAAP
jgi:hypothetical protein